jgi:hypothetical protein
MGRQSPLIREAYKNYNPPIDVTKTVLLLLDYVPVVHLAGLEEIVLTNASGLSRKERRQATKAGKHQIESAGRYHRRLKEQPAWIEIFVDNTLKDWPRPLMAIPFFQNLALSEVLYHEVGHHIQYSGNFQLRDKEKFANKWTGRLIRAFVRKRYWHIWPIIFLFRVTVRLGRKILRLLKLSRKRLYDEGCVEDQRDRNVPVGNYLYPAYSETVGFGSANRDRRETNTRHDPSEDDLD